VEALEAVVVLALLASEAWVAAEVVKEALVQDNLKLNQSTVCSNQCCKYHQSHRLGNHHKNCRPPTCSSSSCPQRSAPPILQATKHA